MDEAAAEEFTQTIEQHLGASWRQMAWALQQDIPQALGLTDQQWSERIRTRVRLGVEERRQAAAQLRGEGMTVREIAIALGVSHATVEADLGRNQPKPLIKAKVSEPEAESSGRNQPESKPEPLTKAQLLAELRQHGVDVKGLEKDRKQLQAAVQKLRKDLEREPPEPPAPTVEQATAVLREAGIDVERLQAIAKAAHKDPLKIDPQGSDQSPEIRQLRAGQAVLTLMSAMDDFTEKAEALIPELGPLPEVHRYWFEGAYEGLAKVVARIGEYAESGDTDLNRGLREIGDS